MGRSQTRPRQAPRQARRRPDPPRKVNGAQNGHLAAQPCIRARINCFSFSQLSPYRKTHQRLFDSAHASSFSHASLRVQHEACKPGSRFRCEECSGQCDEPHSDWDRATICLPTAAMDTAHFATSVGCSEITMNVGMKRAAPLGVALPAPSMTAAFHARRNQPTPYRGLAHIEGVGEFRRAFPITITRNDFGCGQLNPCHCHLQYFLRRAHESRSVTRGGCRARRPRPAPGEYHLTCLTALATLAPERRTTQ